MHTWERVVSNALRDGALNIEMQYNDPVTDQ